MKILGATDTFDDPAIFTPWSIVHLAFGFAAYPVLNHASVDIKMNRLVLWALVHGIFELKDTAGAYFPGTCRWLMACDKSFAGSVGDELAAVVGYIISQTMKTDSLWTALAVVTVAILFVKSPLFTKP